MTNHSRRARTRATQITAVLVPLGYEMHQRGNALLLVPLVPEDASPLVREGVARRRCLMLEDVCPCGATWPPQLPEWLNQHPDTPAALIYPNHHEHCPAIAPAVLAWVSERLGAAA